MTVTAHPVPAPTDGALMTRVAEGDEQAFREVFERHVGAVRGYALGRVGPDGADVVVNDTFTIAWQLRARFDPAATSARPWLYGIATNVMARYREQERRWIDLGATAAATAHGAQPEVTAYEVDPALARAIGTLTPPLRDVLLLTSLGELSVAEAARAIGIRPATARVRLLRARRQVRATLEGPCDD